MDIGDHSPFDTVYFKSMLPELAYGCRYCEMSHFTESVSFPFPRTHSMDLLSLLEGIQRQ